MSTMSISAANQFIGSKISLTSKSDIRYEGTLYSLDLREATISLAKVRSFGTEDRPTDRPIPMKDEIYEFIIFRGSDIKSIDVIEPPKQGGTMPCGLPQDPAIIEVSHFHSDRIGHNHNHNCGSNNHSMRYPASREGVFDGLLRGGNNNNNNNTRPQSRGQNQRRISNDNGMQQTDRNRGNNQGRNYNNRNVDGRSRQDNHRNRGSGGNQNQTRGGGGGHGNTPNRNNQSNNRRDGSRNRNQPARQRGIIEPQMPPKFTFENPFDFEKSNEELKTAMEKLKIGVDEVKKEGEVGNTDPNEKKEEPLIYYDKDKFFDNISCEALERSKGKATRVDWQKERKLNAETFGLPWNPNQQQRNQRNNSYNGRPRNNYRGGYGGGNRYNYNNSRYNNRNYSYGSSFSNANQ